MAQVPNIPLPTVAPSSTQLPYQQIDAPRAAFGAAVLGDAAENLGAAAAQAGVDLEQHAQKMAMIDNQAMLAEGNAQHANALDNLVIGFQQENRGMKAVAALPDAFKAIDTQTQAIASTMSNPTARSAFLADSKLLAVRTAGELRRFASSQREDALTAQYVATNSALMDDNFKHSGSPDFQKTWEMNRDKTMVAAAFRAEHLGYSGNVAQQFARNAYGELVAAQVQKLFTSGDVTGADAFLQAHNAGMNETAINKLQGMLKPALFANSAATLADQVVGETLGVRAPKADAMQTLTAMRQDPIAAIKAATGITVPVAYGARDAARNKQVGGSDTSEHLVNAAWDLQPPKGMSMVQLAQRIHDSGIPYDQLEVQGNHVHVGFKPNDTQRGMIIGDLAGQVHNPSINSALGGAMTSYELKAKEGALQDALRARALAEQPGNMAYADMVVSRGLTQLNQTIQARSYAEQDAGQSLLGIIDTANIKDLPTLLAQPGAAAQYNSLPQSSRSALSSMMKREANTPTLETDLNKYALIGMMSDPKTVGDFLHADIMSMDLTRSDKNTLMTRQIKMRGQEDALAGSNKPLNHIMYDSNVSQALKQLGITDFSSDKYFQFKGAMGTALQSFTEVNGRPPQDKDIPALLIQAQTLLKGPTTDSMVAAFSPTAPKFVQGSPAIQTIMSRKSPSGQPIPYPVALAISKKVPNAQ